ncbi:hypothetical protein [Sporomusa sp. KB1]|jgi:hypothetical protein|uniref:hypothetical protein n=1 Tax=Sporomusa sp. KB1 TaxID=943346 RepID=UPI0011A58D70|nr:hypothetical protein [Sporomusa sp. KB1]TWH49277.1 hypothetical protein Salpa_5487 [Sporomusa sp. KB1]
MDMNCKKAEKPIETFGQDQRFWGQPVVNWNKEEKFTETSMYEKISLFFHIKNLITLKIVAKIKK